GDDTNPLTDYLKDVTIICKVMYVGISKDTLYIIILFGWIAWWLPRVLFLSLPLSPSLAFSFSPTHSFPSPLPLFSISLSLSLQSLSFPPSLSLPLSLPP